MQTTLKVNIRPFKVPDRVYVELPFVAKEDGPKFDKRTFSLSELDPETLDEMCKNFRTAVFKAAGKQFPIKHKAE